MVSPIRLISITTSMRSQVRDASFEKLSLHLDNYPTWSQDILSLFEEYDLDRYVLGTVSVPHAVGGSATDTESFWNYHTNCRMIIGFLRTALDETEREYMNDIRDNPHTNSGNPFACAITSAVPYLKFDFYNPSTRSSSVPI